MPIDAARRLRTLTGTLAELELLAETTGDAHLRRRAGSATGPACLRQQARAPCGDVRIELTDEASLTQSGPATQAAQMPPDR